MHKLNKKHANKTIIFFSKNIKEHKMIVYKKLTIECLCTYICTN